MGAVTPCRWSSCGARGARAISSSEPSRLTTSPSDARPGDDCETAASNHASVAAIELVADTVGAIEPRTMRKRLLSGLVDDLGLEAAMLWTPAGPGGGLVLAQQVGLGGQLAELLARWSPGSTVDRIARSARPPADRPTIGRVDVDGLDHLLYVMALPGPPTELLGVLSRAPLDSSFERLLASVGRAYSVALLQAAVIRDHRHVVDAMVAELRPGDVALPDGYVIGHLYRSATANVDIGGDLYDWFRTDRGHLGVAVGDVSGKGMQAASRAAMAVHSLRAFARAGASPHVMAQMLNSVVAGQVSVESFLTLVYVRVDPVAGQATFVLAGHPPPIVLRASSVEVLDVAADVPLGVVTEATFALHETTLDAGDRLVLFTDGVTEARRAGGGDLLDLDGLVNLLHGQRDRAPQQIADAVWKGVQAHTGGNTTDDCAVVVVGRS